MADPLSTIGERTTLRGTLRGDEDVLVRGRLEGTVVLGQQLLVETTGEVVGDVDVAHLSVRGRFSGTVRASESVVIAAGAVVEATVITPRLLLEPGAHFNGTVQMDVELPAELAQPAAEPARR